MGTKPFGRLIFLGSLLPLHRNLIRLFFSWLMWMALGDSSIRAQSTSLPTISTWIEAARLLDSQSDEARKKAETWLRQELAKSETPVEAAWGLALYCYQRQDFAGLDRVLKGIGQRYPNPPLAVAAAVERFRLTVALSKSEVPEAEDAFKNIVRAILSDQYSKEEKLLNTATIGAVIGMLESDVSLAPISAELLKIGQASIEAVEGSNIKYVFARALETSRSRVKLLEEKLAIIDASGIERLKSDHQSQLKELESQREAIEDLAASVEEITRNCEEKTRANRVSLKRVDQYLATLAKNWKQITPGHPGPERPAPIRPSKSDIYVDPYKTEYEEVTDSKGNRTRVARKVLKSYSEKENERDRIFFDLEQEYRRQKEFYDSYLAKYQKAFASWVEADKTRREKLKSEQQESDARRKELEEQIEALDKERKEATKQLVEARSKLKALQLDSDVTAEVLRANAIGKPETSFRPGFFETILIADERARLLKLPKDNEK